MQGNNLTDAQEERLTKLIEEAAEVIQIACKIKLHGFDEFHPRQGETNRALLEKELGHLILWINKIAGAQDVDFVKVEKALQEKNAKVAKYLKHN